MLPCNTYLAAAVVLCGLLCCSCKTSSSTKVRSSIDSDSTSAAPADDAELRKRAEAHAHYAAGVIEEVLDRPEAALEEYNEAALRDPEESLALEVARRFLQNKKPEKAHELLKRASERPNASAAVFARLGFVCGQLGKYDDAISASRIALKKNPRILAPYQNLFLTYLQTKHPEQAAKVLEEASRQTNHDPEFLIGIAELYIHLGLQNGDARKEANTKALALLNQIDKDEKLNPALQLKLAEAYTAAGDAPKAAQLYQELLKKMPDLPGLKERVRARLADAYLRGNDPKGATKELEALIADDPTNAQAYYSLAILALEEKQPEKAIEHLSKAILLNPDAAPVYAELARLQISIKKTSDALATLEKARAKFPEMFQLEYLSGMAFSQQKAYPEALRHYIRAEVIAQATRAEWLDKHFFFDIAAAYERQGDHSQAEKYFEKCLQLAPDFPEALNYLGYMWAEKGVNLVRARELIEKAVKIEPKNGAYLDSLGWVLFKLNEPQNALDYILKAVELTEEPDATLYDHLGDIYAALNQLEKAREAWKKSLSVEPSDTVRKKVDGK
jgi:tetratricopeptide (TPR) repeat protein